MKNIFTLLALLITLTSFSQNGYERIESYTGDIVSSILNSHTGQEKLVHTDSKIVFLKKTIVGSELIATERSTFDIKEDRVRYSIQIVSYYGGTAQRFTQEDIDFAMNVESMTEESYISYSIKGLMNMGYSEKKALKTMKYMLPFEQTKAAMIANIKAQKLKYDTILDYILGDITEDKDW